MHFRKTKNWRANRLILIDVSQLVRNATASALYTFNDHLQDKLNLGLKPEEFWPKREEFKAEWKRRFTNSVEKIIRKTGGEDVYSTVKVVLARDCGRRFNWRSILLNDVQINYKNTETKMFKTFRVDEKTVDVSVRELMFLVHEVLNEFSSDDLSVPYPIINLRLQKFEHPKGVEVGAEADDIIAIICKLTDPRTTDIAVVSNDSDFHQLIVFKNVFLYDIKGYPVKPFYKLPELIPFISALRGKESSSIRTLLDGASIKRLTYDIQTLRINNAQELFDAARKESTMHPQELYDKLEMNLRLVSFDYIDSYVKTAIVEYLTQTTIFN